MTDTESRGSDHCPGCGGPITFTADNSDGVTVDFHCPNPDCEYGKHDRLTQHSTTEVHVHDPIAYTYDADTHCPGCAAEYAGSQGALDSNTAEDNNGNTVGAIFSWTEWWQIDGKCETLVCGTCRGEIDVAHNDPHSMGCPDYEVEWPHTDQLTAQGEGWDIFECGDTEHEPFELERIDFPEDRPAVFADDTDAWEHVITRATRGDGTDLHNRALLFLANESPGELVHIAFWRAGIGDDCPCVGCTTYRGRTGTITSGTPNTEGG